MNFLDFFFCKIIATFFSKGTKTKTYVGRTILIMSMWPFFGIYPILNIFDNYIINKFIIKNFLWLSIIIDCILFIIFEIRYFKYNDIYKLEDLKKRYYSIQGARRKLMNFLFYLIFIGMPVWFYCSF